MGKFQNGDIVKVISSCQSYGQIGKVIQYIRHSFYSPCIYVQVKLKSGVIKSYNEKSLALVDNKMIFGGNNNMLVGNYNVAKVKFVQGTNTVQGSSFALFDNNIGVDDLVLCDTSSGYNVARVTEIIPQSEYEGVSVTKEIICKVDFTDFEARKENREKAKKLKVEMDKKIKDLQELTLYEMMAAKCPELKEMLDEYKQLI